MSAVNLGRRSLLAGLAGLGVASLASSAWASTGFVLPRGHADAGTAARFWAAPRTLSLVRPATGESVQATYWAEGAFVPAGYYAICRLLRDAQAGQAATIDLRLLNLLRGVQGWLALAGYREPFHVTSGYRTEHTNSLTEGAAKNSLHVRGQAVDGRFPGLSAEQLGRLFQAFQGGGVGIYKNAHGFVHADIGRVRTWRG